MKKILLLFGFFVVATTGLYAQVGIGTTDPEAAAQLEVWATNKGVLIPRVKLTDLEEYKPIEGGQITSLLVYNEDTVEKKNVYPGYYYWYENKWNRVISKQDFNNKELVKQILQGSNVVVHDGNNFVTYTNTTSGIVSKTVDIVNLINSNTTTSTINPEKIKPGDKKGQVLTTKVVGTKTVTVWEDPSKTTIPQGDLEAGDGVKLNKLKKVEGALLKTVTITIEDLKLNQIKGADKGNGEIVTVGTDGKLTTSTTIPLDKVKGTTSGSIVYAGENGKLKELKEGTEGQILTTKGGNKGFEWKDITSTIESSTLSATGGIEITGKGNGKGALLGKDKDITLKIKEGGVGTNELANNAVTNDKLGTGAVTNDKIQGGTITKDKLAKPSEKNAVLKTDDKGDVEWGKITASDITAGDLKVTDGLSIDNNGVGVLLKSTTISIEEIDIEKIVVSGTTKKGEYGNKILTVDPASGKITHTSTLPSNTKVDVSQIKDKTSSASTATKVVVVKDGEAKSVDLKNIVSNTVTVGNGLEKDSSGKIGLGGKLEHETTIDVNGKELKIKNLTATKTIVETDKVVILDENDVMKTVSATAFKGNGNYVVNNSGAAKPVVTGNVMEEGGDTLTEKMVTIPIEVTVTSTNSIHRTVVKSMAGFGAEDYSKKLITEIRIFSKDLIPITLSNKGVKTTYQRRISFLAATLENSGADTVITPSIGGGTNLAVYKGHYYVVIKYLEK